jgi:hypothetical protein
VKRIGLMAFLMMALLFACDREGGAGYPQQVVQNFMSSCTAQPGATEEACKCSIERLQEEMTFEEYQEFEAQVGQGGPIPAEVVDIVSGCAE